MNRRGFLASIAGMVAISTLDPESLVWKPGKLISIPKPGLHHIGVAWVPCEALADGGSDGGLGSAAEELKRVIDREYKRPTFLPLVSVAAFVDWSRHGALGALPEARVVRYWDHLKQQVVGRIDCLVRTC